MQRIQENRVWWMLGVTLVLCAIAWWLEGIGPQSGIVQVAERAAGRAAGGVAALEQNEKPVPPQTVAAAGKSAVGLTQQLQASGLRPVIQVDKKRDPFGLYQPPAPPPKPVKAVAAPPPPPEPPPQAPPFGYRVFGRVQGPDGKTVLYLAREELLIAVQEGTEFDGGFVAEKLTEQELLVRHKPTQQELRVALPKQS